MDADRNSVLEALRTTYWSAAHKEICTMILFFGDVLDHKNDVETHLSVDYEQLDCENFDRMFDLWRQSISGSLSILADNKLVGCQGQGWKEFDTLPLYNETV
jgi:hypothetical protein